jgi:hypothetical protein
MRRSLFPFWVDSRGVGVSIAACGVNACPYGANNAARLEPRGARGDAEAGAKQRVGFPHRPG